jgi:hypothetical protein
MIPHGEANSTERRASDAIRNTEIAQQGADQSTGYNEDCHDDDPPLWRWNFRIVREERDGLWRRGNGDAGPADIINDCGQAAQRPVMNPMTNCGEQAGINGKIAAMEICLAAIAEK